MAGLDQPYQCRNCDYHGHAAAPANAAREVLIEAATADHAERRPDCPGPSIVLGEHSSGA